MTMPLRTRLSLSGAVLSVLLLGACAMPPQFGRSAPPPPPPQPAAPQQIAPVQTTSVQESNLPPLAGSTVAPGPTVTTGSLPTSGATPGAGGDPFMTNTAPGVETSATAPADGGFVSLDDIGAPGNTTGGRDLSGPLTMERLLGGWTVTAGAEQCRLNLTYTAKAGTGRYRASTPGCAEPTLGQVTSWQLLGNQIQLYNEADELVGTLLRSGDRFVGTLSGGLGISMVG